MSAFEHNHVSLTGEQGHRATVIRATVYIPPEYDTVAINHFAAVGEAVKSPEDKFDPFIGEVMATGRALQALGRKMERQAWGLIKHNDDVRAAKRKVPRLNPLIEPDEPFRCSGMTQTGRRCRFRVAVAGSRCHHHRGQDG